MWRHLTHPNVIPLLGVTIDPSQLISGWVSGGDLTGYITDHPDTGRLGLVCPPNFVVLRTHPLASYLMLLKTSASSTPAMLFTEILRECVTTLGLGSPSH